MPEVTNPKLSALNAGTVRVGSFIVNRIGLGSMHLTGQDNWGPPSDIVTAKRLLQRAVDLDVNFIDTADSYGPGVSEDLIHSALSPYEGIIIGTKGGLVRTSSTVWHPDGSPEELRAACLRSLKRLGVDQITLYQLHVTDPKVPLAISLRTLINLKHEGEIRYIGLGNVTAAQLRAALDMTHVVSVRNHYAVTDRGTSEAVVRLCEEQGLAFIAYTPDDAPALSNHAKTVLEALARKHHATIEQINLAWLLAHSPAILVTPLARSLRELETNIASSAIQLDDEDMKRLDGLSD